MSSSNRRMQRPLVPGVYAPTQIFFRSAEKGSNFQIDPLDTETIAHHAVRLVRAGVAGIVTNGSNGEASLLTAEERSTATRVTRVALDDAGYTDVPVVSGASAPSVGATVSLCKEAADAGADAVLLLAPTFVGGGMGTTGVERYFLLVAEQSPLPVLIYNYPAAAGGVDLDSDALGRLAKHPNIIGTKFTCGNVGKMARVIGDLGNRVVSESQLGVTKAEEGQTRESLSPYFAFTGVADSLASAVAAVGGTGGIVGAANIFPRACVQVYNLAAHGRWGEARKAQYLLAVADWSLTKRAVPGFKAVLQHYYGYGGSPRAPMAPLTPDAAQELFDEIEAFIQSEKQLPDVRG
ncbi:aldolase [Thozetella sp. PMI_491]|nr:aldolase [Thozetella sp. PMI_491]